MTFAFAVIQPHMKFGGAERQTVLLLNRLADAGYECHLVLHDEVGGLLSDLSPAVKVWGLGLESHAGLAITAIRLRRTLRQIPPAFVIVKLWSSILAAFAVDRHFPQHRFNYCEDLDPSDHAKFIRFGKIKQNLIRQIFRRRPFLTANTDSVAASMVEMYGLSRAPDVISSVVDSALVVERSASANALNLPDRTTTPSKLRVCSVGSLVPRKGLKTTLEALRDTRTSPSTLEWHVIGEGPSRAWLESAGALDGLTVIMHGGTPNPYRIMAQCDVLVHSAVSEAFGIVILEALSVGLPVIAADAIGPREMQSVLGKREGMLRLYRCGDPEDLIDALAGHSNELRPSLDECQDYIAPYGLDATVSKWVDRAERVCGK